MAVGSDERQPLLSDIPTAEVENAPITANETRKKVEGVRLYASLIFPLIGLLFVALDATMVSTVSATIATEFSSLAVVAWLGSAYLVAVAAIQPISGKLTDRFGRRTGLFNALLCFGVGNLMCGLAKTEAVLVLGRVLAGLGGGAISSIGFFVISDLLPLKERPVWQGLQNLFWALGMGIGGIFGGVLNDTVGWRWSFLIMVPCTLLVAIGIHFSLVRGLPITDGKPSKRIDVLGTILLTSALVSVVLGLNFQEKGSNKTLSLVLLVLSAIIFVCFIVVELWYVSDPVVPIQLLANRSVTGACVSGLLISISMYSLIFYVPILIQVRGNSTSKVGLLMMGNPIGSSIGPVCTGFALRAVGGYGIIQRVVFIVYLVAAFGFYFSTLTTPAWATVIFMICQGAGFGSILTTNTTSLLANIDDRFQASATGMQYAFTKVGASAGLAISGIIFRLTVEKELAGTSRISNGFSRISDFESISDQCSKRKYIDGEPPRICQIYYDALHMVFFFILMTGIASFVFTWIIRSRPLDREKETDENITNE